MGVAMHRIGALALLGLGVLAQARSAEPPTTAASTDASAFVDATREVGLAFVYGAGRSPSLHLPEIMGGGVALFDFDGDGDLDVYVVQAGALGPSGEPRPGAGSDRLLRNELSVGRDGRRELRFVDVSERVGLGRPAGYAMAVAAGDADGDGWVDLLVLGYGSLRLLRNAEGNRLVDVTASSGLADSGWCAAASFLDVDRDGRLDVFAARYVDYAPVRCSLPSGRPDYCGPKSYVAQEDRLFRNLGGGRFERMPGWIPRPARVGAGLGVVATFADDDAFVDLYVANDGSDNHLWLNQSGRGLREDGLIAGVALDRVGVALAGMGVDAGDADGDGDLDLFVTNLTGETNTLYLRHAAGAFDDRTIEAGLGAPSLAWTGFGTRFLDYDNDGDLDLVVVNGAVHLPDRPLERGAPLPLGQPKQLYRNLGAGRFIDASLQAGPAFARLETSRGLAVGDLDDDGDPDLVVSNNGEPARVLLNQVGQREAWLGIRLVEADGRREAVPARATLRRRGAPDLLRLAHTDGSYASASDPRLIFGLAKGSVVLAVDVDWPDGSRETFAAPPLRRYTTLRRGGGRPLSAAR